MKYMSAFVLFLLGAIVVAVYDWYPRHQAANAKRNWSKECAVIVHNELISSVYDDGPDYNKISYKYLFSGREFTSNRVGFGERVPRLSETISAGYKMPCYVNPDRPSESVLFVDFLPVTLRFWGYGFMGIAFVCTFLCLVETWRHKPAIRDLKNSNGIATTPLSVKSFARSGSFSLYKMHEKSNRCIIKPTIRYYASCCFFIISGGYIALDAYGGEGMDGFLYAGLGGMIIGLAILGYAQKITFDGNASLFSISFLWFPYCTRRVEYRNIQAIQLLHHYSPDSEGTGYAVFELNLVLQDNSRIFVVGWNTPQQARESAKKIARQVGGVPIWDHINDTLFSFLN